MNRIILNMKKTEVLLPPCSSKFYGMPDVWDDFMWPAATKSGYRRHTDDEYDLDFICQINCAEVAEYDINGILPKTGMLYFFYDQKQKAREDTTIVFYCDGDLSELKPYLPVDREGNLFDTHPELYSEPYGERLIERKFATELARPEVKIEFEDEGYKGGGKWRSNKKVDLYPHYLLGIPDEDEKVLPNNQQLLLLLNSLYGTLSICYLIDKKDLAEKKYYMAWTENIYD